MAIAYLHVRLTVQPTRGGDAELVLPDALQGLDPHFVVVNEGGQEGILQVDAPKAILKKIAQDDRCTLLSLEDMNDLRKGYPPPKIKQRYRAALFLSTGAEAGATQGSFALDAEGNRIVDTYQTVRSGFYLIDVLVVAVGAK